MKFESGSEWGKWDLHVHSPASFNWGGEPLRKLEAAKRETVIREWIKTINESDVAVFAVMDYWTFDGYIALREYVQAHPDELKKTVLPGIELRVQAPTTERLDIHTIISDEIPLQRLRDFLGKLQVQIIGGPQRPLSPDSLMEFARSLQGDQLKGRSHEKLQQDDEAAWIAGCETCEVTLESFRQAVKSLDEGTAVIYQPWDTYHGLKEMKWRNHYTTAHQLFSQPDIFECKGREYRDAFVGLKTPENDAFFDGFWTALGETPRLPVRGSDAHTFAKYGKFQSNLTTWIKAAPTFRGLLQAIKEPLQRSWLGDVPPKLQLRRDKPSVFIEGLHLCKTAEAKLANEDWFDGQELKLNADLVAVIGSKGSGKSALADIIALLGDTPNYENFSFLTPTRFRERKNNRGLYFEGELRWANGTTKTRKLSDNPLATDIERVRYIPQRYFETVCAGQSEEDIKEFTGQVERVIFSHIPPDLRGGAADLQELLQRQETEATVKIERLRTEVRQLNRDIRDTIRRTSPEVQQQLDATRKLREQQLKDLEASKPPVPPPSAEAGAAGSGGASSDATDPNMAALAEAEQLHTSLTVQFDAGRRRVRDFQERLFASERLEKGLKNLQELVNDGLSRMNPDAQLAGLDLASVITFEFHEQPLNAKVTATKEELLKERDLVEGPSHESVASRLRAAEAQIQHARSALNAQQLSEQAARERFAAWEHQLTALTGTAELSGSIANVNAQIELAQKGPERIAEIEAQRAKKVTEIAHELLAVRAARAELVETARATIDEVVPKHQNFSLDFVNELTLTASLEDRFFDLVKQVSGTFRGEDEGRRAFREYVEAHPLNSPDEVFEVAAGLESMLVNEQRANEIMTHDIASLVRRGKSPEEVLDLLYCLDYIHPQFSLAQGGQPLSQLSPGQRGALLLIFYLLVEDSDLPIVLDQPEENLDNETVFSLLVPAIKQAKEKRQIIMVTHNANLAVCCDAEQIIHATANKSNRQKITYCSGPLEDPEVNKLVIDVLEGTRPAFDSRSATYQSA